jgi:hypothetical protein
LGSPAHLQIARERDSWVLGIGFISFIGSIGYIGFIGFDRLVRFERFERFERLGTGLWVPADHCDHWDRTKISY